jgi:hypothetical protein
MDNLIPLSGMETIEFVPSDFKDSKDPPTFIIRVPTFSIRDKMGAILFQRGLIPVTDGQTRAVLIDALFELYPEAEAEEYAAFLEDYWTKAEVHNELIQGWQLQEAQRIFDIGMGVKKDLPQAPIPQAPFQIRDQARQARIISDALHRHEGYRSFQARNMVAREEEEEMTVRLFLFGWKNCVTKDGEGVSIEVNPVRDDLDRLTTDCIEGVRQWLAEQAAFGAWDEVKQAIQNQFGAQGRLEKNSVSPLDTNSSQSGSLISSGDLGISDGNSTGSSIIPTRDTKSPATSGASRSLRGGRNGKSRAASRKSGQTAEAS